MQERDSTTTEDMSVNDNTTNELENIKQLDCQVGECVNGDCQPPNCNLLSAKSEATTGAKTKRKARSTRRRLNAMINNTSLHFSDTDSEGELTIARVATPNHKVPQKPVSDGNFLQPIISVTLDGSDDSSYGGGRRGSFMDNITDVDELYSSEPETNSEMTNDKRNSSPRGSLTVADNPHQGETDLEDVSNDEEDVMQPTIYVKSRSDILCDFNGETITTKEGDGPFSIEVRNQMSIDETNMPYDTPDIVVMPTTDSEEMEASDEDEEAEGACGLRETYEDFDVLTASQIDMRNVNKMDNFLTVQDNDEAVSDSHTDMEDFE